MVAAVMWLNKLCLKISVHLVKLIYYFTTDSPPWLSTFSQPCERWEGLHLTPELDTVVQAKIRSKEVTLLEFRNYLFQRQCALLLLLNKPWEASVGGREG